VQIQEKRMTGSMVSIRVIIADEGATFRQALRTLLEPEIDLRVVGEASDAEGALILVQKLEPDVVIIDAALFYRLRNRIGARSAFRAVVMLPTLQPADIIKAFLSGARAVVPKPSPRQIWSQSIRTVGAGQYWLLDESVPILLEALQAQLLQGNKTEHQHDYRLTSRDVEIVNEIAQGHSNKQVGEVFAICEKTVKRHLTSIFTKIGVSSRLELAVFALNHRLQTLPPHREATPEVGTTEIDTRRARRSRRG
jgi:two-component system nitrate/nitrite response regulator NarL